MEHNTGQGEPKQTIAIVGAGIVGVSIALSRLDVHEACAIIRKPKKLTKQRTPDPTRPRRRIALENGTTSL
jgi:hypothetical protein